jgi:alanine racemase
VHLKVDTGMRRVGVAADRALELADAIAASSAVELVGVFTHLAVADAPDDPFTRGQLQRFDAVLSELAKAGHRPPLVHAANSAGALAHPAARYDMVRAGIAIYGISPGDGVDQMVVDARLRPALSLRARVSYVKRVPAGDGISYGLRHRVATDTTVATLPVGYADGVPRQLHAVGGEVLLHGVRCPIVGVITMDQLMVAVGDMAVGVGDEAVLIGVQGNECITAADWAAKLDTIAYEVVCGLSNRLERRIV